jgi:dihydroorotate dehydrogenase (fumarate)
MLSGFVGDVKLNFCIYNASGVHCTSEQELQELINSDAGGLVSKSSTLESRIGNPCPRYFSDSKNKISINSTGLANHGYEYYLNLNNKLNVSSKPYFISIATLTENELEIMINKINNTPNIAGVEFNFSCPNLIGKTQVGYDFIATDKLLNFVSNRCKKMFGLKLPPYFEPLQLEELANIIKRYPLVKFLVCINSLGNGLLIDNRDDTTCIHPKGGLGGIGGASLKPFGLSNVRELHKHLPNMSIIGCGGIFTGQDVYDYILCGASAVQIGTCLYEEGLSCFNRIKQELVKILNQKNIQKLEDIRGSLKIRENY